jgi:hypothetical protein
MDPANNRPITGSRTGVSQAGKCELPLRLKLRYFLAVAENQF